MDREECLTGDEAILKVSLSCSLLPVRFLCCGLLLLLLLWADASVGAASCNPKDARRSDELDA
jgi:hypothetical protein